MPTQKTVTCYTFDELSDKAKEKARDWMRECTFDNLDWAYFLEEDAKEIGTELIEWNADYGTAKVKMEDPDHTAALILQNHGNATDTWTAADNYTSAMLEASKIEDDDERGEAVETIRSDFYTELGAAYGIMVRKEYTYRGTDEAIDGDIEANEYLFTESGSRTFTL